MGGAYTAMAGDANSLYYNPAGLGRVRGHELSFQHSQLFEGAAYDYLGYALQGPLGGWGAQVLRLNSGAIDGRDENNQAIGGFSYVEQGLGLGFGTRAFFDGRMSLGTGLKILSRSMGGVANRLYGIDLGLQFNPLSMDRRLRLGLVAANAAAFKTGETDDRLPMRLKAGAALDLFDGMSVALNMDSDQELQFGTEYRIGAGAFRVGYQQDRGPTFGAGLRFLKRWNLDVAAAHHSVLGMTTHVSLGCRFAEGRTETRAQGRLKKESSAAQRALEQQRYLQALDLFSESLRSNVSEADKDRAKTSLRAGRLRSLTQALDLAGRPERAKALERQDEQGRWGLSAVRAFIDREDAAALLFAQAAHGTDTEQEPYKALMDSIASLTYQKPAQDEILPAAALIARKLEKSLQSFRARRFEEAAERCREALLLKPDHPLALVRLGSAYFAMGLKDRALLEWRKALELNPQDEALKDFMRRIEGEKP
jgi:tetratricopeptide (TPR) repeat protein